MIIYPAVAGSFYPGDKDELNAILTALLADAQNQANLPIPKAIIAPHAGYIYSGPIAASAYACLANAQDKITRVVILAPSHQYALYGLATTKATTYQTPLGEITIDQEFLDTILPLPNVAVIEEAFMYEHALEVQLPFLQRTLKNFTLVPLLVGLAKPDDITTILEHLWDGPETLLVISSDLSHYHNYATAKKMDQQTSNAILTLKPENISPEQACGSLSIIALLKCAREHHLQATCIDLRNSGDTAGSKDSVVGYGAFHFN